MTGGAATTGRAEPPLVQLFRERAERLPAGLREHVVRVVGEARRLAPLYDPDLFELDLAGVEAAAWGHDLYRAHADADLLGLAEQLAIPVSAAERAVPMLLHGPVAAVMAEAEWGVTDAEVLEAIRWHTTGRASLSALAMTVFLADKIEPEKVRADPGLLPIRRLAERGPEAALLAYLERQIARQISTGGVLHPASVEARNALLLALQSTGPAEHDGA